MRAAPAVRRSDIEVCIPPGVLAAIDAMIDDAAGVETGGAMVGRYSGVRAALVTEALPPPPDSTAGPTWFQRGTLGLAAALKARWPGVYYLGEWHYHPADEVVPSVQDFHAMEGFASDPDAACPSPIMVIVARRGADGTRPLRVFVFPNGEPTEVRP